MATTTSIGPHVVLEKYNLNLRSGQVLEMAGIVRRGVDWVATEKRHLAEAEARGVSDPYGFRKERGVADIVEPVFGKEGLSGVSCDIRGDLEGAGYVECDVHIIAHRNGKNDILVIVWEHHGTPIVLSVAAEEQVRRVRSNTWKFVHVYENPPRSPDGAIVHTVNCVIPGAVPRSQTLRFEEGRWKAVPFRA